MREDAFALCDEAPAGFGDAVTRGNGTAGKEAAVAEEVLADGVEAALLLLERSDEILQEQVCAGGQGHGVLYGGFEALAVVFDGVEGFEDGGGGNGVEEDDEGFDGGYGLGEVGVGVEEVAVSRDDAGEGN
jgi:hypothetical protein